MGELGDWFAERSAGDRGVPAGLGRIAACISEAGMNKPAAKEPSMDEILSSIRQIIADDDDAASHDASEPPQLPDPEPEEEGLPSFDAFIEEETGEDVPEAPAEDDVDALALSLDQVIDAVEETEPAEEDAAEESLPEVEEAEEPAKSFASPEDIAFISEAIEEPEPMPAPEPAPARTSAMPDPDLSTELAEHLLNETAEAAASEAFSKLGVLSLGAGSQTIEDIVKELLRPMLKAWLDENLPAIVERLVEREIERVSRGGR